MDTSSCKMSKVTSTVPRVKFSDEIFDKVCARIAAGESLRAISDDKGMPGQSTWYEWLEDKTKPELAERYARARGAQAHRYAEEIMEIADDVKCLTPEGANHAKIQIDARKWTSSKLLPKVYNDRMIHAGDSEAPIVYTEIALKLVKPDA